MKRIHCAPFLLDSKVPALSRALDSMPPGSDLKVVIYGAYPPEGHLGYMLQTDLVIQHGSISVICMNGTVTYYPEGKLRLHWKTKALDVQAFSVALSFVLHKDQAGVFYQNVQLPDGTDLPEDDRTRVFLLPPVPGSKGDEFILEFCKSPDFKAGPSEFHVSQGDGP